MRRTLSDRQRNVIRTTVERYKDDGCQTLEHLGHLTDDVYGILFQFAMNLDHDDQVYYAKKVGVLVTRCMFLEVPDKAECLIEALEKTILNGGE